MCAVMRKEIGRPYFDFVVSIIPSRVRLLTSMYEALRNVEYNVLFGLHGALCDLTSFTRNIFGIGISKPCPNDSHCSLILVKLPLIVIKIFSSFHFTQQHMNALKYIEQIFCLAPAADTIHVPLIPYSTSTSCSKHMAYVIICFSDYSCQSSLQLTVPTSHSCIGIISGIGINNTRIIWN